MEYQYDQLGRLISAATQGAGGWGLAWNHDGFGNLTQQSVTKGQMTGFTLGINGATNRITGQNYDANGNWLGMWPMGSKAKGQRPKGRSKADGVKDLGSSSTPMNSRGYLPTIPAYP